MANSKNARLDLLDLPPEITTMIWKRALPPREEAIVCCRCINHDDQYSLDKSKCGTISPMTEEPFHDSYSWGAFECLEMAPVNVITNILLICRRAFMEASPLLSRIRTYATCSSTCSEKLIRSMRCEYGKFNVQSFLNVSKAFYWSRDEDAQDVQDVQDTKDLKWYPYGYSPQRIQIMETSRGDLLVKRRPSY